MQMLPQGSGRPELPQQRLLPTVKLPESHSTCAKETIPSVTRLTPPYGIVAYKHAMLGGCSTHTAPMHTHLCCHLTFDPTIKFDLQTQ